MMGLNMYLEGEVYFYELSEDQRKSMPVQQTYRLGQWMNWHPLNEYVFRQFSTGGFDSKELELGEDELRQLLDAFKAKVSAGEEHPVFGQWRGDKHLKGKTIEALVYAIDWVRAGQPGTCRSVWYRTDWQDGFDPKSFE